VANPTTITVQLPTAVANGISTSQTPGGAGNLTITGSLAALGVANLVTAQRVFIASAGADSARVFTVFGTDRNGNVITEVVTGVATPTPVHTVQDFLTVTRIAVDAATAGAITAGTGAFGSSPWQVCDFLQHSWGLGGGVTSPGGTTYAIEITFDDPNKIGPNLAPAPQQFSMNANGFVPPKAWTHATLNGTTSGDNQFNYAQQVVYAIRVTVTAGTGLCVLQIAQNGI
jgi:hypothetical protein